MKQSWRKRAYSIPSTPIPLSYQFDLIKDEARITAFSRAIDKIVQPGDAILDVGAGTGILAFFAMKKAAKGYAVESDAAVAAFGQRMLQSTGITGLEFYNCDILDLSLPSRVDVIISEIIDTGFINENQLGPVSYAVEKFLKTKGAVIPSRAISEAQFVYQDYCVGHWEFRLPHYQGDGKPLPRELSYPEPFQDVTFKECNPILIDSTIPLTVHTSGIANSLRITTKVELAPDIWLSQTPWFCEPMIIPLEHDALVSEGTKSAVRIRYVPGKGAHQVIATAVES